MKTEKYAVTGMTCTSCVAHVERSVNKLEGIQTVQVNLLDNSMTVNYDETKISTDTITKSVEDAGYEAHVKTEKTSETTETKKIDYVLLEQVEMKRRWWISLIFLVPLLYLSMGHMFGWPLHATFLKHENALTFAFTQFLLTLPIAFINKKDMNIR